MTPSESKCPPQATDIEALETGHRVLGWLLILGPLPIGLGALALALGQDDPVLAAIGLLDLMFAAGGLVLRRAQSRRIQAAQILATQSGAPSRPDPPARAGWRTGTGLLRDFRVVAFAMGGIVAASPWTTAFVAWAATRFTSIASLSASLPLLVAGGSPRLAGPLAFVSAGILATSTAALVVLATYFRQLRPAVLPEAAGLGRWCRAAVWFQAAGALECLLHGFSVAPGHAIAGRVSVALVALLGAELMLRALTPAATSRRRPLGAALGAAPRTSNVFLDSLLLRLFCSRFNPSASLFGVLAEALGIDLKSAWALRFVRRSLVPLMGALLVLGWACTGLISVATDERGVHERFGRPVADAALSPGLHLVLPWPIDRVHAVSVDRIRSKTIGYRGQRDGASMLWTATHAEQEHKLLVGDGRDLVSVNATLNYKVSDAQAFVYRSENPELELESLADRVLMRRTVERSLDALLGAQLSAFAEAVEDEIRREVVARGLGIDVVDFTLSALHPPVEVAEEYQAVVAARIARETSILQAEQDRAAKLPAAEGEALQTIQRAEAEALRRVARANGEAAAFLAVMQQSHLAPALFALRRRLEVLEETLKFKTYHILDDRIERDGGTLWMLD